MTPLDREFFAQQVCSVCGGLDTACNHDNKLYLHVPCHPTQPPWFYYEDGVLRMECRVCHSPGPDILIGGVSVEDRIILAELLGKLEAMQMITTGGTLPEIQDRRAIRNQAAALARLIGEEPMADPISTV